MLSASHWLLKVAIRCLCNSLILKAYVPVSMQTTERNLMGLGFSIAITAIVNGTPVALCTEASMTRFWRAHAQTGSSGAPHIPAAASLRSKPAVDRALAEAHGFVVVWLPHLGYYTQLHPLPSVKADRAGLDEGVCSDADDAPGPPHQYLPYSRGSANDPAPGVRSIHHKRKVARSTAGGSINVEFVFSDQARAKLQQDMHAALQPFLPPQVPLQPQQQRQRSNGVSCMHGEQQSVQVAVSCA
jgi:hypothetical protein